MKLSFRNRIALFTALAAAATIGLVFLILYFIVYRTAYQHLDDDLRKERKEVMDDLRWVADSLVLSMMPEWEEKEHQQVEVNPVFLQISDRNGLVLFRSSNLQKDTLVQKLGFEAPIIFDSRLGVQRIRQGQFPINNDQGMPVGQLVIGISQQESALVLLNLRTALSIAFPMLLLVLFLATSLAASKGIAPVTRLIQAASNIGERDIRGRLPLPENDDEIRQLALTINELLQRIENGIAREKQFTADASHEIRTPLTAIRGTLEVLIRKPRQHQQYEEKISQVIRETDRLHNMLDQLLQLARIESGNVPVALKPVTLAPFVHLIAEKWAPQLERRNMTCKTDIPTDKQVQTDPALLEIIMDNLIGNSVKYGHEGGNITCIWSVETRTLSIRDNGPGISREDLPKIFDRFYRADASRSARVQGTGLGLSIALRLAELLQIGLYAESRPGEGTHWSIVFP